MSGRDRPWLMRTYSGHSSAAASNALYRRNIAAGQTGLSVAFDLPTQTGYDADHPLAAGEVGKVGVPVSHIEDMEALFDGIDMANTNTSMTINATAPWLLALYVAAAERRGVRPQQLSGTTQNDIIKEYLSRGTHIFPPAPSLRLTRDLVTSSSTSQRGRTRLPAFLLEMGEETDLAEEMDRMWTVLLWLLVTLEVLLLGVRGEACWAKLKAWS